MIIQIAFSPQTSLAKVQKNTSIRACDAHVIEQLRTVFGKDYVNSLQLNYDPMVIKVGIINFLHQMVFIVEP